jgi:hypothetical protein
MLVTIFGIYSLPEKFSESDDSKEPKGDRGRGASLSDVEVSGWWLVVSE